MNEYHWAEQFRTVYEKMVAAYRKAPAAAESSLGSDDLKFLESIGCTPHELYDFAEDWCVHQEPGPETALLIAAARRDYFLVVQKGRRSRKTIDMGRLPEKDAAAGGLPWLPRIIAKAEAKLRGEMPPELMFCCGGDRSFLDSVGIHPADFLRMVWASAGDEGRVVRWVKKKASRGR